MSVQTGNDDARSVLHAEWNLLDALATVLVLCTNGQTVRTVVHPVRIEDDVGRQLAVDDRLGIVVEKHANARLVGEFGSISDHRSVSRISDDVDPSHQAGTASRTSRRSRRV